MALHRFFYITTVYDEMNQPCARWARSWHMHYSVRRNPVASGEWFDSIPHFFVQKMHSLLSCLKYQGKVLQEEFDKLLGGKRTSKVTAHLEALEDLLTEKSLKNKGTVE